jgi:hypothetical protein
MFRLPSWISESRGCDKVVNGEAVHKMANATRPVVEIFAGGKRKRDSSMDSSELEPEEPHGAKRRKTNSPNPKDRSVVNEQNVAAASEKRASVVVDLSQVREAIESQFSLEILLKHNELRLINQELAKCQVGLEQLRRCHLIPYPTSQATPGSMANVSNGTGPAVWQGDSVPQWAPPYGVTDGPYTRHYSRWLIPDPSFDGEQVEWQRGLEGSRAGKTVSEGRATRHSFAEGSTPASKSRSQRGSSGQKLQALSNGYPQAKEKAGPCILKRANGQMVKLVCIDCNRDNFSSTQGFINHCRIAHRRDFKSHEEAAQASGQPIEVDEGGGIVGEEKSPAPANGLVHPMIRSAPTNREAYLAVLSRIQESVQQYNEGRLPGVTSIPTSANSTPSRNNSSRPPAASSKTFVPSPSAPFLSEFLRSKGFGGNLNDIVGDAKQPVDFDDVTSEDGDSDDTENRPTEDHRRVGGLDGHGSPPIMRIPARAGVSPAPLGRPTSSKGMDGRIGRQPGLSSISPRLSHVTPAINTNSSNHIRPSTRLHNHHSDHTDDTQEADVDMEMMDGPSIIDLSPHTVASNNAPSLVSDDGEYDEGDDAESATSEEDEDSVAEIDIEDDGVDKVEPRAVLRNRTGSEGMRLRKEDKHVTFVSQAVKETGKERRTRRT